MIHIYREDSPPHERPAISVVCIRSSENISAHSIFILISVSHDEPGGSEIRQIGMTIELW